MVIDIPCPVCAKSLKTHTCIYSKVPIWIEPHEYLLGADPIGQVCGVYLCPYLVDEHPVVERLQVNGF